jgi:predicted GNAT superfamily acetyltransferase
MGEDLEIRPLATIEEMRQAAGLIDRIWEEERVVMPALLRALSAHGNPVYGAWRGGEMVGAQLGFMGITEEGPILHSHITGVAPGIEHRGVGFVLKLAQRQWCLDHGVDLVTWTFDPMIARNAYFNLVKLGATADRFHRDYYGEMEDAFNVGERSDRLEVRWEVRSPRVETALAGGADDAEPDPEAILVRCPEDYLALRERDPEEARRWRDRLADELEEAFAAGYVATGFRRGEGYVLERAPT